MKAIKFKDPLGNVLAIIWNADPLNCPLTEKFPHGWTWEELTRKEILDEIPKDSGQARGLPEPAHKIAAGLKKKHESLVEEHDILLRNHEGLINWLEEKHKLPTGQIKDEIDQKIKKIEAIPIDE